MPLYDLTLHLATPQRVNAAMLVADLISDRIESAGDFPNFVETFKFILDKFQEHAEGLASDDPAAFQLIATQPRDIASQLDAITHGGGE